MIHSKAPAVSFDPAGLTFHLFAFKSLLSCHSVLK